MEGRKNFQSELMSQGGGLPVGVDPGWADKYLRLAFEHASGLPHRFELVFKSKRYEPTPADVMKRLGGNHREKLEWYFGGRVTPGSTFSRHISHPYNELVRHSFSNQAYRQEALHLGTTHVAVGFVDLGILLASTLQEHPKGHEGPLHFLGIEMSENSCDLGTAQTNTDVWSTP